MRFVPVAVLLAATIGCQGWHYGMTPYAGVNGDQDGNVGWNVGIALGLTNSNVYVPPPVINQTRVEVRNSVSVKQSQSQNQNQNQSQTHQHTPCNHCGHCHGHGNHHCDD